MKSPILTILLLVANIMFAQVGIRTSNPQSSLHIQSSENLNSTLIISSSTGENFIKNSKNGSIGINTEMNDNLIKIAPSDLNYPTIKVNTLSNFGNYPTTESNNLLGMDNSNNINLQESVATNYILSKRNGSSGLLGTTNTADDQIELNLQEGIYELTGFIIYSGNSTSDFNVRITADKSESVGYFMGAGHYGTYTNDRNAVSFSLKDIHNVSRIRHSATFTDDFFIPFGSGGENIKLIATIKGFVTITELTKLNIVYRQQSNSAKSTIVHDGSFLFAKKIN